MTCGVRPSAEIVVIGDEVLGAKVEEANTAYLLRRFRELGIEVTRVVIVPDRAEAIAREVRASAQSADVVITTGGVGPTHDDVTIDAIAAAWGVPVVVAAELEVLVRRFFGAQTSRGHLRLARIPQGATLEGGGGPPWPTVRLENVWILPGIPRLMRAKFDALAPRLTEELDCSPLWQAALWVTAFEADVVDALEAVVAAWPDVAIGSYPRREEGRWRIRITLESTVRERTAGAARALEEALDAAGGPAVDRVEAPASTAESSLTPSPDG